MGLPLRGPDPADDTQIGNFGWLKRFLGWTTEIDFAAALNGALTTPPRAGGASEAQTGVTQFATAAEVAAGTVATKSVSPLRLAAAIADLLTGGRLGATSKDVSNGDWNNQRTTGFFMGNAMANAPAGDGGWFWVTVQRYADTWVSQVAHNFVANSTAALAGRYQRTMLNGVWTSWQRIVDDAAQPVYGRRSIGNLDNFNTLLAPGAYQFNGGGGQPSGYPTGAGSYGMLLVFQQAYGVTQVYIVDNSLYYRTQWNATNANPPSMQGQQWNLVTATGVAPKA